MGNNLRRVQIGANTSLNFELGKKGVRRGSKVKDLRFRRNNGFSKEWCSRFTRGKEVVHEVNDMIYTSDGRKVE